MLWHAKDFMPLNSKQQISALMFFIFTTLNNREFSAIAVVTSVKFGGPGLKRHVADKCQQLFLVVTIRFLYVIAAYICTQLTVESAALERDWIPHSEASSSSKHDDSIIPSKAIVTKPS